MGPSVGLPRVTKTAVLLGFALGELPNSIWKGAPLPVTLRFVVDGVVYALVSGLSFSRFGEGGASTKPEGLTLRKIQKGVLPRSQGSTVLCDTKTNRLRPFESFGTILTQNNFNGFPRFRRGTVPGYPWWLGLSMKRDFFTLSPGVSQNAVKFKFTGELRSKGLSRK